MTKKKRIDATMGLRETIGSGVVRFRVRVGLNRQQCPQLTQAMFNKRLADTLNLNEHRILTLSGSVLDSLPMSFRHKPCRNFDFMVGSKLQKIPLLVDVHRHQRTSRQRPKSGRSPKIQCGATAKATPNRLNAKAPSP